MGKAAQTPANETDEIKDNPTPVQSETAQGEGWEDSVDSQIQAQAELIGQLMVNQNRIYLALRALYHTFDTPSNIEKRQFLEPGIKALNKSGEFLGREEPPIPLM